MVTSVPVPWGPAPMAMKPLPPRAAISVKPVLSPSRVSMPAVPSDTLTSTLCSPEQQFPQPAASH
jgi:hypothetical protein